MLYQIAHILVSVFAKFFFRLKVIDVSNVPKEGGVIVAANHNSYFDIPLLGCALNRPADNIAKSELFQIRVIAALFRALGGFPVRRGRADRKAIEEAVRRLKAGRLLSYYPEGTRSKDGRLQKGKSGIGWVVAGSGARVVPAYIKGTHPTRIFRQVTIRFGRPIDFNPRLKNLDHKGMQAKNFYGTISAEIMEKIAQLEKEQEKFG